MSTDAAAGPRVCSVARTLEVVGEKWALLAVREVFLGNARFDGIVARTGAPRDTLTNRLRTLVAEGVLERRRYSERPPRDEYVLTAAGRDLYPVVLALLQWGDTHRAGPEGPPLVLEHGCGEVLHTATVCRACGKVVRTEEVSRARSADHQPTEAGQGTSRSAR